MEILVLDLECGNIIPDERFEVENDIICDIAIVNINLETGIKKVLLSKTCQESTLCHPDSWIFQNSTLTYDEVIESESFDGLKEEIQIIFNEEFPVTSWNQRYDFPRLEHPSRGIKIPVKFWDPMRVLKPFLKLPFLSGEGYKWPKLPEAYEYFFHVKKPHTHRALADAQDTADILFEAVEKWPILKNRWEDFIEIKF